MHRVIVHITLTMLLPLIAAGCASTESANTQRDAATANAIASEWIELDLRILDKGNYAVLYQVDRKRAIRFGGGRNAMNDHTTWSGVMSEDAYTQLCRLVDQARWAHRDPASNGEPPERVTRITARTPAARNSFQIKGENPQVREALALLEAATRSRLEKDLEILPEPDGP